MQVSTVRLSVTLWSRRPTLEFLVLTAMCSQEMIWIFFKRLALRAKSLLVRRALVGNSATVHYTREGGLPGMCRSDNVSLQRVGQRTRPDAVEIRVGP